MVLKADDEINLQEFINLMKTKFTYFGVKLLERSIKQLEKKQNLNWHQYTRASIFFYFRLIGQN